MVRRLPVIQTKDAEDAAAEARPQWHWVVIGTGFIITIWIPLAMIAVAAGRAFSDALTLLFLVLLSFALACIAAGALVGRFGGRAGRREATLSGLVAATAAWLVAFASGALTPWPVALASGLILPVLALLFASWGGRIGIGRRPRL